MTGAALLLLALALVAAVVDWIAVDLLDRQDLGPEGAGRPAPGGGRVGAQLAEYVAKPLTLLLLIGVALALDPDDSAVRTWFFAALVLSLAGDVFLMLERRAEGLFVAGLGSFLLGHLAYIGGFLVDGVVATRFGIGVAVVAVAVGVLGLPILRGVREGPEPALSGPVVAYMLVISTMVACAIGAGRPLAVVGAVLFYASDSLIALHRFVRPVPHGRLAIMTTYHLAQVALVLSLV